MLDLRLEIIDQSEEFDCISFDSCVTSDGNMLHCCIRGSDENSWQKEWAKNSLWLNHEHMRQFCKDWCRGWSNFESGLFYTFMYLLAITLPWQIVFYTVIGLSGTRLKKFTAPCETLAGQRVLLVTTGCHSSGLALRFTASRPPPDHEEMLL